MNLLLVETSEIDGGVALIRGRRARHAHRVLGARPGDELRIGVARGGVGRAEVLDAEPERLRLALKELSEPPAEPPIDLVLALPRPKAVGRVLQAVASMGVRRVDLVNAWRVDKTYFSSRRLDPEALAHECWLGCEQGAHTYLPEVKLHPLLMPFLHESLAPRAKTRPILVFEPRAEAPLEHAMGPGTRSAVALIGPEGGWIHRELAALERLGGLAVSLGERVLRTEVAAVAALAQLELLRRLP